MEIFVFARLHARAGKRAEVRQAMFDVQGPTRKEPGCLAYGAFRSVRDPDEFLHPLAVEGHGRVRAPRGIAAYRALHGSGGTLSEQIW